MNIILTTLGARLCDRRGPRVCRTPVKRLRVWVDPEEPLVPPVAVALADRLTRVLIQELSDHGLGDRVDDIRIRGLSVAWLSDRTHTPVLKVRGVHENVIV